MARVFRPTKPARKQPANKAETFLVEDLDHEAQGIARTQPVTFVQNALPGETCKASIYKSAKNTRFATAQKILSPSPLRVAPFCPHFELCGGCQTQYIAPNDLLPMKQDAVASLLHKFIGIELEQIPWQAPLQGNPVGYRRKARLAIDARKPSKPLLGFRGDKNKIIPIRECRILVPELAKLIQPLQTLVGDLKQAKKIGHISLLAAEQVTVGLRIVAPLIGTDVAKVEAFATNYGCRLVWQQGDTKSIPESPDNAYTLTVQEREKGLQKLRLGLAQDDFIQINAGLNQAMVNQAIDWLAPTKQDKVLDLFCGVGNFSLPLALNSKSVLAIEGVPDMVQKASQNALLNGINNLEVVAADLSSEQLSQQYSVDSFNLALLDPARDGAYAAITQLLQVQPQRIVYVSCNPATFARDVAQLLQTGKKAGTKASQGNYQLDKINLLDMFPYTSHTELMALFTRL